LVRTNRNNIKLLKKNDMAWDWGGIVKGILPSVIGVGAGLIANNQAVQNAKGEANTQKELLEKQKEIALINQKNIELMQQGGQNLGADKNNNTALYVGLGVGGFALLGVVIFAVTRK
jgi:hypothetical protein